MDLTPLGLRKPIGTDHVDLRIFIGENMDLLDAFLANKESKLYKQSTAPTAPVANDLWINISSSPFTLNFYDGTTWSLVGGASTFTEDATHRWATDAEKNAWNAKADASTTTTALNNKVDVVVGKGLSTNDYTTAEKDKLSNLSNYSNQSVLNLISDSAGSLYYKGAPIASGGSVVLAPDYVVKDAWNTTGTRTLPAGTFYKFYINNTGTANLTFTINSITLTVKPTEEFEDIFDPFTQVIVSATSTFDASVSGLKSGSSIPTYSVKDYFAGSTNTTRSFSASVYGIIISNDGLSALTYTVGTLTLTVEAGDVVEKYFDALTEVTVISTVAYRAYIKSGINAVVTGTNVADTTAPNNVANLTANSVTATTLILSWNASVSSDVASYDVYNGVTLLGNSTTTSFNVTGLTEKTQYTFYVKAKDSSNNIASGTSLTTTTADVTAPANATNLTTASVSQTTLTLNWTASVSSDVASYDVYNGSTLLANVTAVTYNVIGLTAGTNYTFNVKAKDTSNNASGSATVSTITIPLDVTSLTTSNVTSTNLTVNWFASTGAASYDVYNGATLLGNTASNSYNVSGLTANTQYTFKVIAKNSSGTSTGVTTIATTSTITVNPVTQLAAGTATINSIPVTWVASTSTIASQEVTYSTDGTNYSTPVTISSSATSYTFTGLTAGTTYTLRVVAIDASANRSVPATVQKATAAAVSYTASATPPAGTYGGTQNVVLSCTPTGATIYYTVNGSTPTTASSVYVSTAIPVSTTQTIKFFAQDSVGNQTTVQTANYTIDTVAPSPAITPTAGTPTSSTIPVSWTLSPSSDVANYEVAYSSNGGTSYTVASAVINSSSTSYTVTGLAGSTLYTLRIVAIDGAGNRSTAVTTTATTTAAGLTSVTSGVLHSYDFRGGTGYTGTVADSVGTMPLTLTNFKTDSTEGFITGGLKHAGAVDTTTGVGYAINNTIANLGMTTGSSFTVVLKATLNASNYATNFFATSKDNAALNIDGTPSNTLGRFQIMTTSVGALHVHPQLRVRDSTTADTNIIRDDSASAASSITSGGSPVVFEVTYDSTNKTISLYLNGTLNKSAVLTNHAKFDGINLCSGQKVDHALLIYNRVLTGGELTQVSTDLLALS